MDDSAESDNASPSAADATSRAAPADLLPSAAGRPRVRSGFGADGKKPLLTLAASSSSSRLVGLAPAPDRSHPGEAPACMADVGNGHNRDTDADPDDADGAEAPLDDTVELQNVTGAQLMRESGHNQRMADDTSYLLDGLGPEQENAVRIPT